MDILMTFFTNLWAVFVEAGPWLLVGYAVAILIHAFIPISFIKRHLGGQGYFSVIKAALVGAPLPLCSCGVVPVALSLRKAGASKGATTSFLVSTPETGVDSFFVSYALLGPFMAIIRPIAAISSALSAGFLVERFAKSDAPLSKEEQEAEPSCCASKKQAETTALKNETSHDSIAQDTIVQDIVEKPAKVDLFKKLGNSFQAIVQDVIKGSSFWLLLGLIFAALMRTVFNQPNDLSSLTQNDLLMMIIMVLIGLPLYICATASTPLAAGFLAAGISPGAVLVFMLAGPATNISTLGIIKKTLGKKTLFLYLTGVIVTAILFGLLTDYLIETAAFTTQTTSTLHVFPMWFSQLSAIIIAVVLVWGVWVSNLLPHIRKLLGKKGKQSSSDSCCSS